MSALVHPLSFDRTICYSITSQFSPNVAAGMVESGMAIACEGDDCPCKSEPS